MKWIKRSGVILGASIALALGITSGASAQNEHSFNGKGIGMSKVRGTISTKSPKKFVIDTPGQFMPNEVEPEEVPEAPANFHPRDVAPDQGGGIGTESAPQTFENFAGMGYTGWIPPDPEIAVGPYGTVSVTNSHLILHSRSGAVQYQNSFASFVQAGWTYFDPKVAYDAWNGRFVILVLRMQKSGTFVTNEDYLLLYSDDSDANGDWSWRTFDAKVDGGTYENNHWLDYPYLGITYQGIAMSGIKFPQGAGSGSYSHLRFVRSSEIYGGGGAGYWDFWGFSSNGSPDYRVVPARQIWQDGNFYAVNSKEGGSNTLTIRRFQNFIFSGGGPTYSTVIKTVGAYASPPNAIQKGDARRLEVIDCRVLACTFSSGRLFVTHQTAQDWSDGAGNRCALKSYRFDQSLNTQVDDILGAGGYDYYYPAIASNNNGDAMLSFARSGATEYASIRTAGCKVGETSFSGSAGIFNGLAGYFEDFGYGRNRWGDYFGASVDGWDLTSFYGVGQYAKTTNQWQCQIWRSNYKPSYVFSVAAASGQLTGTTTLSATLTRSDTSAPLSGVSVPFSISGSYVGSGTTNASGVATFVYAIPFQVPTTRTISCSLGEDGTYNAGSGSAVLTIQKANTAVYIYGSTPTAGTTQPLYQYLYRTTDNTYVNGESLEFWVDGSYQGSANMVSNLATFNFAVPIAWQGVKSMWGYYPGNTYYNASVDYGGTMEVYRPTQHNRWDGAARRTEGDYMWIQYLDYNGVPVVNGDVYFYYDGVWDGVTRHTDSGGYAYRYYTVGAGEAIGAHSWDAYMYPPAASPYFQSQHAVGTFTVKGPSFIGSATLSDWNWSYYLNRDVRIKIKNSANVVVVNTVVNAPYGYWEVPYSGPTGTYKVFIQPSHWLSQYVGSVAFTSTTYGSAWQYTTHENGDCNGDNIVDLTDYTQVVVAFNGIYGSAPYTDPADLNGDGVVDLTDYTVIITNFNHVGQQYGF